MSDLVTSTPPSRASDRLDELLSRARRAHGLLAELFSEEGTSVDQWRTLRAVRRTPAATVGELSGEMRMPPASFTRVVDGLVDRALLYRTPDPADRRRIVVHLSELGHDLVRRLDAIADSVRLDG